MGLFRCGAGPHLTYLLTHIADANVIIKLRYTRGLVQRTQTTPTHLIATYAT